MAGDQYFTAEPDSAANWRPLSVELAGKRLDLVTASGIFASDALDRGTHVLLEAVPEPPAEGVFLDLGSGWGPIAITLALRSPGARVYAVEVNERARAACARNAETAGCANLQTCAPEDVPADVRFDLIWSNPPIRIGKAALHDLLGAWLERLAPHGEAWLVVAKQLGAQTLLKWLDARPGFAADRAARARGFHVLQVRRTG